MYSDAGDTTSLVPGFPIRTSSDPRSVDSSPRLIAASYVLHRLPVPRHPPCALKHLQTQKPIRKKKLHIHKQALRRELICEMLATTIHKSNTTPHHQSRATTNPPEPQSGATPEEMTGLLPQSPIVCSANSRRHASPRPARLLCTRTGATTAHGPSNESPMLTEPPHDVGGARVSWCSLERR